LYVSYGAKDTLLTPSYLNFVASFLVVLAKPICSFCHAADRPPITGKFESETKAFAETVPFETRSLEAARILAKYPDRCPIICERAPGSDLPEIEKKKFLVPGTMLCGEFKYIVHKHINRAPGGDQASFEVAETMYLYVNKSAPRSGALMSEIYDQHKDADGFLYVPYGAKDTLLTPSSLNFVASFLVVLAKPICWFCHAADRPQT